MKIDKILIIRFSSLGDIVLITAFIRELRKYFPKAQIDFLTSTTFSGLLENNPHLDNIIPLDRKKKSIELNRIVTECHQKNYDLLFDAHRSLRSRLFIFKLFGIQSLLKRNIIRIDKRSLKRNLLLLFKINKFDKIVSQRRAYCQLLIDVKPQAKLCTKTELFPGEKQEQKIEKILYENSFVINQYIAIGPGASFPGKCWPKEHYLELIQELLQQKVKVVILGGGNEAETDWLLKRVSNEVLDLSGQLSFLESATLLKYAKVTICNDSAIMHFSEAVKTPAFTFFGPTVKEFGFGPHLKESRLIEVDLPCRPCSRNGKGKCKIKIKRQCLKDISVDKVLQYISSITNE